MGGGDTKRNETTLLTGTPFPPPPDLQQGDLLFHGAFSVLERVDAVLQRHDLAVHEFDLHVQSGG